MFNLFCALIIALLGVVGILIPLNEVHIVGIIFFCASGIWLFASFVNNLECYTQQIQRFEDVRAGLKKIVIYKERQNNLLAEFKLYLAEKYPEIEKEIYKLITESQSDVHVVLKYPEIKSSKTLIKLVEEINTLADDVYSGRTNLEYYYAQIRFFNNNKWFYFMPEVPEDVLILL